MGDPLASLIRPEQPPILPALARLAPPPPANLIEAELDARTAPGDIVLDLHGRGGWVARAAVNRLRRAYAFESSALTRLLAEVVLRPPDLRHFDAAVKSLTFQPRGHVSLHQALNDLYASTCPGCERAVIVEEFIWDGEAEAPERKLYRCPACREQLGGPELRTADVDERDIERIRSIELPETTLAYLLGRFPVLDGRHELPEALLKLYTPRNLICVEAVLERLRDDLRAAPLEAALRLALLHVVVPGSRLNTHSGRPAPLRISNARFNLPANRQWREHNPWHLFLEGCQKVRAFLHSLEGAGGVTVQARLGEDLWALMDGSVNVVLKRGSAAMRGNEPVLPPAATTLAEETARAKVRLVLTQPPPRWSTENLSFAYLASALVLGRDAAASLPLEALFGPTPRSDWGWEAAALRRSLAAVAPALAPDARAVVMLEPGGPEGLVAGALGGVGAGYRLTGALLAEAGDEIGGTLEFAPPETTGRDWLRSHARGAPPPQETSTFRLHDLEEAVTEIAVSVLQARGEPARFERLLAEVLVGLDRVGHLRRLVGTRVFSETVARAERAAEAVGLFGELPASVRERARRSVLEEAEATAAEAETSTESGPETGPTRERVDGAAGAPEMEGEGLGRQPATSARTGEAVEADPLHDRAGTDQVSLLLDLIVHELRRPTHPRLDEVEPGRWWLRDRNDIAASGVPLCDRVEWAVFSLLSTSPGLSETDFFERIAGMFRGHDTPDEPLVRACLESYRSADSTPDAIRSDDRLQARYQEHTELIGLLTEFGHRIGLRCWINKHEQKHQYRGVALGSLLSELEQRTYLPLVSRGSSEALEQIDCIWYMRGRATLLFEVDWTAMLGEPLLRRGRRIPTDDRIVRFLVIPPERAELVRFKLERSPIFRQALDEDNWHLLKADHLRTLVASEGSDLERLAPYLGLDPDIELQGEQLPLFEG
ncbi:MAG TPA: hypothetical protein VGQ47_01285 [Candidatus Limnocylindrales bacterium]|jgi:hypothetical protein|nr:hypothetical protein [Candidatus Limnocylindrales bacterium]